MKETTILICFYSIYKKVLDLFRFNICLLFRFPSYRILDYYCQVTVLIHLLLSESNLLLFHHKFVSELLNLYKSNHLFHLSWRGRTRFRVWWTQVSNDDFFFDTDLIFRFSFFFSHLPFDFHMQSVKWSLTEFGRILRK